MTYHLQSKGNDTRNKEIYVSSKTKQRLFWIRQIEEENKVYIKDYATGGIEIAPPRILTIDDIAERLLNERIEQLYPNMKVLEKRAPALENQLVIELLSPPTEK